MYCTELYPHPSFNNTFNNNHQKRDKKVTQLYLHQNFGPQNATAYCLMRQSWTHSHLTLKQIACKHLCLCNSLIYKGETVQYCIMHSFCASTHNFCQGSVIYCLSFNSTALAAQLRVLCPVLAAESYVLMFTILAA